MEQGKGVPEDVKENLVDVGLGFLIMTLRTQEMKGKVDKWDYFRLICFGTEKKKSRVEEQPMNWETFCLPCV